MKHIVRFILIGLVLLAIVVVYDGFYILEEGKQVVITQFGAPVGTPDHRGRPSLQDPRSSR